jgi:peptidyl-prolyl cis-trans isomerase C
MKTILLLTMAAAAAWAQAPAADPVVITIGNEKITKSTFDAIIGSLSEQQQAAVATPEAKRNLAEQIAELKMMAQEARARRLDQSPALQAKIVLQAETVLAQAVYAEMIKESPSDAAMQAYYKEHENEWIEAKGRHILIRFEGSRVPAREGHPDLSEEKALEAAKAVRAKLVAGGSFAELAKAESDDQGSGENGGDLGTFAKGAMVEEFDKVAFELPVGIVSEPVKSAFGYHLILIESRGAKKFDEVKADIETAMKPELGAKAVESLKAKTPVVLDEGYFGKAPAPTPAPLNN